MSLRVLDGDAAPTAPDLTPFVEALRTWTAEAIVRDAYARRNLAVHAHYAKRPNHVRRTWLLKPVPVDGSASPYQGPLDVHGYCEAYIGALTRLEQIADACRRKTRGIQATKLSVSRVVK